MEYIFIALAVVLALGGLVLTVMMCWQESRRRKISFIAALLLCILITPLLGYFVISNIRLRPGYGGCKWCGNSYNEAEYCGTCGKNSAGDMKPAPAK